MFGSTFTGEDDEPEDLITWEERMKSDTTQPREQASKQIDYQEKALEYLSDILDAKEAMFAAGVAQSDFATMFREFAARITPQAAPEAPTDCLKMPADQRCLHCSIGRPEACILKSGVSTGAAPEAPATQQAGAAVVKLEAFKGADTKQWHVVVKHPFGTSWVKMSDPRDIKLAELLAAPPAATTASASGRIPAQEFLNWNRQQEVPLVAIGKELGVFRKAMEFAGRATAPSRDAAESFADWLKHEMPAGTVIADPAWWAPRILRAAQAAQAAHAGADTERLDWIMKNNGGASLNIRGTDSIGWFVYNPNTDTGGRLFATSREAIDAAMSAATEKKEQK